MKILEFSKKNELWKYLEIKFEIYLCIDHMTFELFLSHKMAYHLHLRMATYFANYDTQDMLCHYCPNNLSFVFDWITSPTNER